MDIVDLIAEDDKVVGRFSCSGTHQERWRGQPPTGRRFRHIAEVNIFTIRGGRITAGWGLEDTLNRRTSSGWTLQRRRSAAFFAARRSADLVEISGCKDYEQPMQSSAYDV